MRNDSADGRTVGAHSEAFSGGAYSRWACWTQADSDSSCAGSGSVDSQHRCAMAHAAAKLSELQNCASTLSNLVLPRDFASGIDGRCQRASIPDAKSRGSTKFESVDAQFCSSDSFAAACAIAHLC